MRPGKKKWQFTDLYHLCLKIHFLFHWFLSLAFLLFSFNNFCTSLYVLPSDLLCIYFGPLFLISNVEVYGIDLGLFFFFRVCMYCCKTPPQHWFSFSLQILVKQGGKVEKSFGFAFGRPGYSVFSDSMIKAVPGSFFTSCQSSEGSSGTSRNLFMTGKHQNVQKLTVYDKQLLVKQITFQNVCPEV